MANPNDLQIKLLVDVVDKNLVVLTQMLEKLNKINEITTVLDRVQQRMSSGMVNGQTQVEHKLTQTTGQMQKLDNAIIMVDRHGALPGLNKGLSSAHSKAKELAQTMGMLAGPYVLHATKEMVEEGAHREEARHAIRVTSNSEQEVMEADRVAAIAAERYPLTTQTESYRDWSETRSMSAGDHPGGPIDYARQERNVLLMAKARQALAASGVPLSPEDGKALAQALEASGRALDPKGQERMLDAYVRAKQTFGTAIKATDVRDFAMNAKAANFSSSDESFFMTTFARLAQGNASRLGNEFAQTMSTLVGGHMTKQGAQWLADLGIIKPGQIKKGGGGKFYIRGGLAQQDLLSTDQTAWAQQVLMPAIEKKGVVSPAKIKARADLLRKSTPNADEHTLEERAIHGLVADFIMKSGFRPTVTDNLTHAIANMILTNKDIGQMKSAMGLAAADTLDKNPVAALQQLTAALQNFAGVLSAPIMQDAAAMLTWFAGHIAEWQKALSDFNKEHPVMGEILAGGAITTGATVGGLATYGLLSNLMSGFGLKGSAAALDKAALDLMAAAAAQKGGALPSAIPEAAAAGGFWATTAKFLKVGAVTAGSYLSIMALMDAFDQERIDKMLEQEKSRNKSDADYPDHGFHHASPKMRQPLWMDFFFGRPEDRIGIGTNQYTSPNLGFLPAKRLSDTARESDALGNAGASTAESLRAAREGVTGFGDAAGNAVDTLTGKVRDLAAAAAAVNVPMPRPSPRADLGASLPDRGPGTETR